MIQEVKERRGCWRTEWEKNSLSEEQSEGGKEIFQKPLTSNKL